jgi:hypothetical protein
LWKGGLPQKFEEFFCYFSTKKFFSLKKKIYKNLSLFPQNKKTFPQNQKTFIIDYNSFLYIKNQIFSLEKLPGGL